MAPHVRTEWDGSRDSQKVRERAKEYLGFAQINMKFMLLYKEKIALTDVLFDLYSRQQ
jgi:hypothetical protein